MSEPDMTPMFESVAPLVDGEGTGEPCPVPVLAVGENGEVEIRHVPQDEHDCGEFVDMQPDMGAVCVVDDEACPCALYGTPCKAYEADVDPRRMEVGSLVEVALPDRHGTPVTIQSVDDSAELFAESTRRVRLICRPDMDPAAILAGAIIGAVPGPVDCEDECTCEFSRAEYPIMVRCADPLCPLPPIELPTYEDSVAWARIHRLTGCTHGGVYIESGSGEISR